MNLTLIILILCIIIILLIAAYLYLYTKYINLYDLFTFLTDGYVKEDKECERCKELEIKDL